MFPAQGLCSFSSNTLERSFRSEENFAGLQNTGDMFKSIVNKQYRGATVLKTSRAIYAKRNLSVVDARSLYPSIIIEFNI